MNKEKQIDYKEFARQMRQVATAFNGTEPTVVCSKELWEYIASMVESFAGYRKQSEGEWKIKVGPLLNDKKISCSICGYKEYRGPAWEKSWGLYPYCPSCGAKMKGGKE